MISSSVGTQYKMDKIENKIKIMSVINTAILVPYVFERACEKLNQWSYGWYESLLTIEIVLILFWEQLPYLQNFYFPYTVSQTILNQIPDAV